MTARLPATGCAIGLFCGSAQAGDEQGAAARHRFTLAEPGIAALYPTSKPNRRARWMDQNGTFDLPGYLSRRGEVFLIGPEGLIEDSARLRLELKPDADHALSLKLTW